MWEALSRQNGPDCAEGADVLADDRDATLTLLEANLKPVSKVLETQLKGWIEDLDHPDFDRREKATKELTRLCAEIEPLLEKTLKENEVRRGLAAAPGAPGGARHRDALLGAAALRCGRCGRSGSSNHWVASGR